MKMGKHQESGLSSHLGDPIIKHLFSQNKVKFIQTTWMGSLGYHWCKWRRKICWGGADIQHVLKDCCTFFFYFFKLMFEYSCLHFPTTTFPCPTHTHLPSLIPPLLGGCTFKIFYSIFSYTTLEIYREVKNEKPK